MTTISVIIPVKNEQEFLDECLESITTQSFEDWEAILVNDHSSDDTEDIIKRWASKHSRLTLIQNNGVGIIDALNTGISKSQGHYVTRMDADDIMPKNKLEILHKISEENPGTIATGNVKYLENEFLKDGFKRYAVWLNSLNESDSHFNEIYKECPIASPAWMMERKTFDAINGFNNLTYPEDFDFAFRCMKYGVSVKSTSELVHIWRDYPTRTSRTDIKYADNSFLDLKVARFLEISRDKTQPLQLWGAGKKGKKIALLLNDADIDFQWLTDNPNKIGHEVHGKILKNYREVVNGQLIIGVSSILGKKEIKKYLADKVEIERFWFS